MKVKLILLFLIFLVSYPGQAQEEEKEEKLFDHYFGLQVNELLRQILNLNVSESMTHPYFLNYSLNHHQTGWGLNTGFGYTYQNTHEGDAINKVETSIDEWAFRIGPEKKFYKGKRLILGLGLDLFLEESKNISTVTIDQGQDQFIETIVENKVNSRGLGPRFSISFKISSWFLAGTEASYYYSLAKTEMNQKETFSSIFSETTRTETEEFDERNLTFNMPTVIFLIFLF